MDVESFLLGAITVAAIFTGAYGLALWREWRDGRLAHSATVRLDGMRLR